MSNLGEAADHILREKPNVWLTSFHGWSPETWGCVGFTRDGQREHFLAETEPGALIVIYGTTNSKTPKDMRSKVLGIYQTNHETGHSHDFLDPMQIERLKRTGEEEKWRDAVNCVRAWTIDEEHRPYVNDAFPEALASEAYRHIGSQGVRLGKADATFLLDLSVTETEVYGGPQILDAKPQTLRPTKAGPNQVNSYSVAVEPDGPKSIYILELEGDAANFLGITERELDEHKIVKVGYSSSPASRRDSYNAKLPVGSYRWKLLKTSTDDVAIPNGKVAKLCEDKLKEVLFEDGDSLGHEFFRAHPEDIDNAWYHATLVARKHS